jgi:Helix-turn-helix domain
VAISVSNWVWDHSKSRHGARLVLLAIADCAKADGGSAWPSVKELGRKTQLKERAVRAAITELAALGELDVEFNTGPGGCNRYRVVTTTTPPANFAGGVQKMQGGGAENAPLQNLQGSTPSGQLKGCTPAKSAPPAENAPLQKMQPPPANFAPGTVIEPEDSTSLLKDKDSVGETPTLFAADEAKPARKRQRATGERIPPDFAVDADMRKWAAEKIPGFSIDTETENFIDYWKGRADSGALKADWVATWRTWMRRAAKDAATPAQTPRGSSGNSPKRGHQPYRNPTDPDAYTMGFTDD